MSVTTACGKCGATVATDYCTSCGSPRDTTSATVVDTDQLLAAGRKGTWIGLALLVGGMLVTFITYMFADAGSSFQVLWGAVVIGAFLTVRGLTLMWKASRLPAGDG